MIVYWNNGDSRKKIWNKKSRFEHRTGFFYKNNIHHELQVTQPSSMVHTAPSMNSTSSRDGSTFFAEAVAVATVSAVAVAVADSAAAAVLATIGSIFCPPCFSTVNCTACVAACVRR